MPMTTAEQISAFEATRQAKAAQMADLMTKAADTGETLDEESEQLYDTLESEVKSIDKHLARLQSLERVNAQKAAPAQGHTQQAGAASRGGVVAPRVSIAPQPQLPGLAFAQMVKCLGIAQGNRSEAAQIAAARYGESHPVAVNLKAAAYIGQLSDLVTKVAVSGATTIDPVWASPLVVAAAGEAGGAFSDFVEFLRPLTIVGKFGTGGIPGLRRVPFRTGLLAQTTGGQGYWVGEGDAKPLTKFDVTRTTMTPLKVANIAVCSDELIRDGSPSADVLVRDTLAEALRERMDRDFIDPAKAAVAGVSPASITNGITPIQSAGMTGAQVRQDVRSAFAAFIAANNPPTAGVWVMRSTTALALSMMVNALGEPEFPGITMNGGTFAGLPVIVSEFVPASGSPTGDYVVLVNATDIWFADDGGISVDMSREASLQMDDSPTMSIGGADSASPSEGPTGVSVVSMFQTNSVAFRAERTVNWARRRSSAVVVLWGVNWGE